MIDNTSSCGIYKASTSDSGEYFLLENRSTGGYDEGPNSLSMTTVRTTLWGPNTLEDLLSGMFMIISAAV
ncbi:MAG: hypothetical protein CM1200mP30_21860 [Pseudomonadota bacterium]|nr:MAG: hypothetical protein CM1200mP30_21860 [Pseudomonadota bacterium]